MRSGFLCDVEIEYVVDLASDIIFDGSRVKPVRL